MTKILSGKEVAEALDERSIKRVKELKAMGVNPTLAILRVSDRPDDISYEKSAAKRCEKIGVGIKNIRLATDVPENIFFKELKKLNEDVDVHGILMFRPLPPHIDEERAMRILAPEKDVDGATDISLSGVFTNTSKGFAPCTPQAVMEIIDHYDIDVSGKKICVLGRSLVVGRPLAMMLTYRDATVVICHTKTVEPQRISKQADIVICATGAIDSIGRDYLSAGQTVIDVGIGYSDRTKKLCGDLKADEANDIVSAMTPVPGGVGSVTTSVLVSHVIDAAERAFA